MREPRYSILVDIQDATERAKQGKLALYWQRTIQREYRCKKVTPAEQQAYEQLQSILSEMSQWSDEEELRSEMEEIGGRVWFCHFWIDHNSMVQLTEDRLRSGHGRFPGSAPRGCTAGAEGAFEMYAGMGHFASECACPGTDEVCFSGTSRFSPYASSQ